MHGCGLRAAAVEATVKTIGERSCRPSCSSPRPTSRRYESRSGYPTSSQQRTIRTDAYGGRTGQECDPYALGGPVNWVASLELMRAHDTLRPC